MKIAVIGSGYVGLVAGICFSDVGNDVTCVDSNPEKISKLKDGKIPFYEPGLQDLFDRNISRIHFSSDIAKAVAPAKLIFIAVGTPELANGDADMQPTLNVLKEICLASTEKKYVVLKSTVPIGTSKKVESFCREYCKHEIEVINNPEFLKQGSAVDDFLHPDRVVIGCRTEEAQKIMTELYKPFINGNPIIFMDNTSAEMTKYAANSFLALKISFINELALLADKLGADINSVRRGFTSDSRINPAFFYPGLGYGGSCFPKDVRALINAGKDHDLDLKLVKAADDVNERQKTILFERIKTRFGSLKNMRIAIWGLSFKPQTDDVRRAPSVELINALVDAGASVVAYDPVAGENAKAATTTEFTLSESPLEAVEKADALVLVTEWNVFRGTDLQEVKRLMKKPVVFDGRNIFDPKKMKALGFEYFGIGQQS